MNSMLVAPAIMVGIGLFFGTVLAIAQRFLKVDEDPRIEATNELLPGTNRAAFLLPRNWSPAKLTPVSARLVLTTISSRSPSI